MAQIWDKFNMSKAQWMNMPKENQQILTKHLSTSATFSNMPENNLKGAKDYLGLITKTTHAQIENLSLMTQIGKHDEAGVVAQDQINSLIEKELTLRKQVVTQLGQVGSLQQQTSANILDAAVQLHKFGIDTTRTFETLSEISEEVGRNLSISSEDLERLTLMSVSLNMTAQESAEVVKGFEQMGLSMGAAVDKSMEMAEVARLQGLNVDKFMGDIANRMDTLNSYNFADGVKGFARMAAQAQKLGLDMGKVVQLAEKVMSPEGAIELARQATGIQDPYLAEAAAAIRSAPTLTGTGLDVAQQRGLEALGTISGGVRWCCW